MKKLILLSILLIVGCAPTKPPLATFYIGMSEEEFLAKNEHIRIIKSSLIPAYEIYTECDSCKKIGNFDYSYGFKHDTLISAWHGKINLFVNRELNYDKYATPPELKEPKEPQEPKEGVMPTVPDVKIPVQPTPPKTEEDE